MALIGETGAERQGSERELGGDELACGELHSQPADIVPQRAPAVLSKHARQVDRVNAGFRRDRFKREMLGEPVLKEFTHTLEPRWRVSLLRPGEHSARSSRSNPSGPRRRQPITP